MQQESDDSALSRARTTRLVTYFNHPAIMDCDCASAGEGLRFQGGYLEFWDHGHRARYGSSALSQIPTHEGRDTGNGRRRSIEAKSVSLNAVDLFSPVASIGLDADAAE